MKKLNEKGTFSFTGVLILPDRLPTHFGLPKKSIKLPKEKMKEPFTESRDHHEHSTKLLLHKTTLKVESMTS